MQNAVFCFYGELNNFLTRVQTGHPISVTLSRRASVKDMIEALGVPHPEVELIMVNGVAASFSYLVTPGDNIHVYPATQTGGTPSDVWRPLRPPPCPCFVLDQHLGTLARYLRMLGFDTLYRNDYDDEELAAIAATGRILLTRDRGLLKRGAVVHGRYMRNTEPSKQVAEVLERFGLYALIEAYKRCIRCNALLRPAPKEEVLERVPPKTREHFDEYRVCTGCGKVYWKGSHHEKMERLIGDLLAGKHSRSEV